MSEFTELQELIARSLPPGAAVGIEKPGCRLSLLADDVVVASIVDLDSDPSQPAIVGGTRAVLTIADGSVKLVGSSYWPDGEVTILPKLDPTPI